LQLFGDSTNPVTTSQDNISVPQITTNFATQTPTVSVNVPIPDKKTIISEFKSGFPNVAGKLIDQIAEVYAQTIIDIAQAANKDSGQFAGLVAGLGFAIMKALEFYITADLLISIGDPDLSAKAMINTIQAQSNAKQAIQQALSQAQIPVNNIPPSQSNINDNGQNIGTGRAGGGRGGF
jgi:uncharacterized membrane protein